MSECTSCNDAFAVEIVTTAAHALDWHVDMLVQSCGHYTLLKSEIDNPAE